MTIHECPYCPDGSCGTCRDARWMAVVRRLWRQRDDTRRDCDSLRNYIDSGASDGELCIELVADLKQANGLCEQHRNAYEDEHRRATRLQERVSWLENNWGPKP